MNKTIENIVNGTDLTRREYFELINSFDYASLTLQKGQTDIFTMSVNRFRAYQDTFEFSQENANTQYAMKESDIESVKGKMLEPTDTLHITARLKDGLELHICVFHTDASEFESDRENFHEIDVYDLQEYLDGLKDSDKQQCQMVKISDVFGFDLNLIGVECVYVKEDNQNLHIRSGNTTLDVPLYDDSCNGIYQKTEESGSMDTFLIKPYGQPFLEIRLFITKGKDE